MFSYKDTFDIKKRGLCYINLYFSKDNITQQIYKSQ